MNAGAPTSADGPGGTRGAEPARPVAAWRTSFWSLIGRHAFRCSPHAAHGFRRRLLRLAGASLRGNVKIRRSVLIDRPWHLSAGHLTVFGDDATLRLSRPLHIGERCVVSQLAIVTTQMLDPHQPTRAIHAPITIEDDCWVAADALVLPGTIVRAGTVVGARALAEGELPGWSVAVGQPARPIKARAFVPPPGLASADGAREAGA